MLLLLFVAVAAAAVAVAVAVAAVAAVVAATAATACRPKNNFGGRTLRGSVGYAPPVEKSKCWGRPARADHPSAHPRPLPPQPVSY